MVVFLEDQLEAAVGGKGVPIRVVIAGKGRSFDLAGRRGWCGTRMSNDERLMLREKMCRD